MPHAYADRTLAAYRRHAPRAIANWARYMRPSPLLRAFVRALPAGARVLDYGCGIGTDLAWMAAHGLRVEGLDGTPAFVRAARRRCPRSTIRLVRFERARLLAGRYDGIWSNAALLHLPPEALARQLARFRRALAPGGLLGMTLAWGRARAYTRRDWIPDRYVAAYSKSDAAALMRGWRVRELRVVDNTGRQGRWIWIVATRGTGKAG